MSILSKLLERRGIKNPSELSGDERVQFDDWQRVLSKQDITLKDIEEFCVVQLNSIDAQFKDLNTPTEKQGRLILLHSVYSTLRSIINSPRQERENLEKYLNQLL